MALTLTTNAEILLRAGEGASSTITGNAATVTALGEEAEGELCADTRRDWVGDYASCDAMVKKLLNSATASKAALKIAGYTAKNYSSRFEWLTLLNYLDNEYLKAVKTLSAIDANNIRGVTD